MIYNEKMTETPVGIVSGQPQQKSRMVARLAWITAINSILLAGLALIIAVRQAVVSGSYTMLITHQTLTPFITIGFAVIGALVTTRQPKNLIGWIFEVVGSLFALTALTAALAESQLNLPLLYNIAAWFNAWLWIPAILLPWTFVPLLFPNGRLLSARWRIIAGAGAVGLLFVCLSTMFSPGPVPESSLTENPFGVAGAKTFLDLINLLGSVFIGIGFLGSLASFFIRLRRSAGIQREQMKWLFYSFGLNLASMFITAAAWLLMPQAGWLEEITITATNLGILSIAAAAAIAILRYRLYDINLIINRTLVYTALTVGVAALYGLIIGALSAAFQARSSLLPTLLATGLAALLIQPMRDRLQRLFNHLMYGERDDPYAVLSGLSRRLESSLSPEDTLPAVVETIAQALKLPYVAIALRQEDGFQVSASYGTAEKDRVQLPLIYQGETIGQLRLLPRAPNEPFTPGELHLLQDIARQVGVTAHTVRLTQDLRRLAQDLQRSREALVRGREEERRRLRRDLHDDLGPQLASLKLNLDVARNLVTRDPLAAEALLRDLRDQSQLAIADIRQLVYDLRPPALDELGLAGAVQEYARQLGNQDGLQLHFKCPNNLPPLPAAAEVAAYRITLEALANTVRHSQGQNCSILIAVTGKQLQVEVADDGQGISSDAQPGVGLSSMRERAAELGGSCTIESLPHGGTRVLARLPLNE